MANNRKYLGIRFPFSSKDSEGFFVDLDYNPYKEIKNGLIHLLFTTTGQRLRNPSFGSRLIELIFEPNDSITHTDLKIEIQEIIKKYYPGITLKNLIVTKSENDMHNASIKIDYEIDEGVYQTFDSININI